MPRGCVAFSFGAATGPARLPAGWCNRLFAFCGDHLRGGVDHRRDAADVAQLRDGHPLLVLQQRIVGLHAEVALADDRRGERVHLELALVDATVRRIRAHPQLGALRLQVGIVGHLDIRIPGVVHPHQRGRRQHGVRLFGRQDAGFADRLDEHRALRRDGRRQRDAHRVGAFERRARDRAVEVQANVLRVVGNTCLNRIDEFH